MEETKKNKRFIWLIVILIILVLGLVGYIIYDKLLKVDKVIPNNDKTKITTTTTLKNEIFRDKVSELFVDYPIKNDETVIVKGISEEIIEKNINHKEVYENKKSKFVGTDIEFTYNSKKCNMEEVQDDNGNIINYENWCEDIEISIDGNHIFTISVPAKGPGEDIPYILITNNYIISQYDGFDEFDGNGVIKIFNLKGKLIKEIKNTSYMGMLNDCGDYNEYENTVFYDKYVIIDNNKLYYVSYSDVWFPKGNTDNASINYLDLDTMTEKVLKKFKARFTQQC